METKKKIRRVARMQFTKILNKIESSEGFSHDGEVHFMLLNDLMNKLNVLNHEIEALVAESCDEAELEKEYEEVSSYREKWFALQAKHNKSTCTSSTAHKVNVENEKKYKLPVLETKLLLSDFQEYTKFPILLPAKNTIVRRLVQQRHRELKHAGANQLIVDIRTRFWIIGIRRLAKSVIAACTICTRFRSKKAQAPTAPLPSERVWCTAPFQVSGVDLAGPLFLKNGEKCWVVLFTCAVYRCVHLELSNSLSTEAFMLSLRRFIARRGRVRQIISDNGTNFHGTKNRLSEINWEEVQKRSTVDRIKWKMNAPTAAWWGGFFERLIRIMKELLRRILGQSRVNYQEMETILCECEAVMNQRPLTYVQDDDNNSLEPLTPACFIQCIPESDVTDLDAADAKTLNIRLKYVLKLKEDFKQRFKMEYLTTLVQRGKDKATNLKAGDVVLIETEEKRVKWPLGIIEEIYTGNDGIERTAKVKTAGGSKVRPFQRIFPLEVSSSLQSSKQESSDHFAPQMSSQTADEEDEDEEDVIDANINDIMLTSRKTRCGRTVKLSTNYGIWSCSRIESKLRNSWHFNNLKLK